MKIVQFLLGYFEYINGIILFLQKLKMEVNLLIIDDHMSIIEGYKSILAYNTAGYEIKVVAANSCQEAFTIITNTINPIAFDLIFLDITLPPYKERNILSGPDLFPSIKEYLPNAKFCFVTSHSETFLITQILKNCKPNGFLIKSDFSANEFIVAFETLMKGENCFSKNIIKIIEEDKLIVKKLDHYNIQIILLLSQGLKSKSIQEELHLSKSAIDKRKSIIKDFFDIEKGSDEDIIREARKQGLI
jgi:two-component system, NarL family, response regulator NreC